MWVQMLVHRLLSYQVISINTEGLVAEEKKVINMVNVLSKIAVRLPALNSKASGIAVAAVAAGIIVLWKKKLNELSDKRYENILVQTNHAIHSFFARFFARTFAPS